MALSNYTNIASSVENWLNRSGFTDVTAITEDFIIMAQRRIQRDVRIPTMEVFSSGITVTSGQSAIPTDMLDVKEMVATDGSTAWPVVRSKYSRVRNERLKAGAGPSFFDTVAGNFEFGPEPSSGVTVDLVYYRELESISTTVAQNWFSTYAPELILFGAMIEAAIFLKEKEMQVVYEEAYTEALKRLKDQKSKAEWSGTPLQVHSR